MARERNHPIHHAGRRDAPATATHTLLRLGSGVLFMQHGAQKLLGLFGGAGDGGTVELMSLMGLAGVLELFGGFLLVIGLLTRPVAVLLVIQMIAAYFMAHAPQGGVPVENGGELALLYGLVWAYFAGAGPGPISLDHALFHRRHRRIYDDVPTEGTPA